MILLTPLSFQEKVIKAKEKILEQKRFSPSLLNSWSSLFDSRKFLTKEQEEKGLIAGLPTDEELLNAILGIQDITEEGRRKINLGFGLENSIAKFLKLDIPNKDVECVDEKVSMEICDYIKKIALENKLQRSWISQQEKICLKVKLDGLGDFIVNGIIDMIWLDKVFDFKYTEASYTSNKYYSNFQHKVYLSYLMQESEDDFTFEYLISKKGDLFIERYNYQESYLDDIKKAIYEVVNFMKSASFTNF